MMTAFVFPADWNDGCRVRALSALCLLFSLLSCCGVAAQPVSPIPFEGIITLKLSDGVLNYAVTYTVSAHKIKREISEHFLWQERLTGVIADMDSQRVWLYGSRSSDKFQTELSLTEYEQFISSLNDAEVNLLKYGFSTHFLAFSRTYADTRHTILAAQPDDPPDCRTERWENGEVEIVALLCQEPSVSNALQAMTEINLPPEWSGFPRRIVVRRLRRQPVAPPENAVSRIVENLLQTVEEKLDRLDAQLESVTPTPVPEEAFRLSASFESVPDVAALLEKLSSGGGDDLFD